MSRAKNAEKLPTTEMQTRSVLTSLHKHIKKIKQLLQIHCYTFEIIK